MLLISILLTVALTYAEREHKVHNIVLYPEKHSWCQITPIQQVVASSGYKPVTIDNNVCVGACFSYSIPKTQPAEPGEQLGPYCDSCQPSESKCYHVTLQAESDNTDGPVTVQKTVQIITNCSCMSCEKIHRNDCEITEETTEELPLDFFVNENKINSTVYIEPTHGKIEEVPELLSVDLSKRKDTHHHRHPSFTNAKKYEHKYELTAKLIYLLKDIQEKNGINLDKHEIKELIKMIQGSEKKLNDKNLMEFVNFVNVNNVEDFELDLGKLKEILGEFQKSQGTEIDSGFGLERGEQNNADIERDFAKLAAQYELPENFGIESSVAPHLKGSHIGMGIKHVSAGYLNKLATTDGKNTIEDSQPAPIKFSLNTGDDDVEFKPTKSPHHGHHEPKSHHPHHHIGEEQQIGMTLGHLVTGPHGSMAFSPIKVEEKLNLDTENLKPNDEGTVISYENHHKPVIN